MALVPLERRAASGELPEPQRDCSLQGTTLFERIWNPLVVPNELYIREGLNWQPHQPVSLTVEINGKRDGMKYATVMQLEPKVGFVARLGHPGAAVKFQNLHLVDVKRSGRNDVHICLGDLTWTRARAAGAITTALARAPTALPPSGTSASPEISEAGATVPEACVLLVGEAGAGLLSGSSSEGTTVRTGSGARSLSNLGADLDGGTSSDSPSHGDAASDTEEKATLTSAAGRMGDACIASELPASGANVRAVNVAAADAEGAAASGISTGTSRDGFIGVRTPSMAMAHAFCCGSAFCPCHWDAEGSPAGPVPEQPLLDASPNGSVVAGRETCFSKAGTSTDAVPVASATAGALAGAQVPSLNAAPATGTSGGGPPSHLSYERLRNLALRPILKSTSSVNINAKAAALDTSDCGRPRRAPQPSMAHVSLPPLRTTHGSVCGATVAGDSPAAGSNASRVVAAGDIIDRELVLPHALAVKRMADTHALVNLEIDGEMEDCKVQYRLARSHNGRTLTLQDISRPLRGLVFQSICEAADGDILVRATTAAATAAAATSPGSASAAAEADVNATLAVMTAARPTVALSAVTAVPSSSVAPVFSRSSSGRLRRPSLKLREGAEEAAAAGSSRTGSIANALGRPPTCGADKAALRGLPAAQPAAPQQQVKRRSKTSQLRPPAAAAALLLLPKGANAGSAAATGKQQQSYCQEGYETHAMGSKWSTKRARSGAAVKGRPSLPSMASEEAASKEEEGIVQLETQCRASKRCRRAGPLEEAMPPPPLLEAVITPTAFPPGTGSWTPEASVEVGPLRRASGWRVGPVACAPPPRITPRGGEASKAGAGPVGVNAHAQSIGIKGSYHHMVLSGGKEAVAPAAAADEQRAKWYSRASHIASFQLELNDDGGGAEAQRHEQAILETLNLQGFEADGLASPRSASARTRARVHRSNTTRRSQHPLHVQRLQETSLKCYWDGTAGGSKEPFMSGGTVAEVAMDIDAGVDDGSGADDGSGPAATGGGSGDAFSGGDAAGTAATASSRRHKSRARGTVNKVKNKPNRHPSKISNVIRNAGAILLMIGAGRTSEMYEKQLRATFGNNPDTSKALRLLEEQGKVKREGKGYRMHPFSYKLTPVGRIEYERLLAEAGPSYLFAIFMGVHLPPPSTSPTAAGAEGGGAGVKGNDDYGQEAPGEGPAAEDGVEAWASASARDAVPAIRMEVEMEGVALQRRPVPAVSSPVRTPTNLTRLHGDAAAGALSSAGLQWPAAEDSAAVPFAAMPANYYTRSAAATAALAPPPPPLQFPGVPPLVLMQQLLTAADAGGVDPAVAQAWYSMPAATGAAVAIADGNRSANSPSASAHSAQQSNQQQHLSGTTPAEAATGPGPTSGVAVGCPQTGQQQLLIWPANRHPFSQYGHSQVDSAGYPATKPVGSGRQVQPRDSYPLDSNSRCVSYPGDGACNSAAVLPVTQSHSMPLSTSQCQAEAAPKVPTATWHGSDTPTVAAQTCCTAKLVPASKHELTAPQPQPHGPAQTPLFTGAKLSPRVSALQQLPHSPQGQVPLQPSPSLPPLGQQHAQQERPQLSPPLPQHQEEEQEAAPEQQQQQQQQDSLFRYVVRLPEGAGYRAEVPSTAGIVYYSPCFATGAEAAAAADLLMSKLRPNEQLNLGIRAHEAAWLASLTVDQVQAMLWQIRC